MRMNPFTIATRAALPAALAAALLAGLGACQGKPKEEASAPAAVSAPAPAASAAPAAPAASSALPPVAEPANKASLPAKPGPGAVAVVNGEEISDRTFADDLAAASLFAKQATEKGRREVLDRRIDFMLQIQDARRLGFLDRPMVRRMIERVRRGYVAAEVRGELARDAARISDAEIAARIPKDPVFEDLTVILAETREAAEQAIARVKAGEDMEAIAKEMSLSPGIGTGSARRRGHEGRKGMYPDDVEEAIAALPVGGISAPLQTPVGFLVARVDARRGRTDEELRKDRERAFQDIFGERSARLVADLLAKGAAGAPRRTLLERIADAKLPDLGENPAAVWRDLEEIRISEIGGVTLTLGDNFHDVTDYDRYLKKRPEDRQSIYEEQRRHAEEAVLLAAHGRAKGHDRLPKIETAMQEYVAALLAAQYAADLVLGEGKVGDLDDAAAQAFFEEHRDRFPTPDMLTLSQILVRREGEARSVRERLRAGGTFAALARELSVDPSAAKGGDLGTLTAPELEKLWGREMTEQVAARARRDERGPFTLRSTGGYHVIMVRGFVPAGSGKYETVREGVRQVFLKQRQGKAVTDRIAALRAAAVIGVDDRKVATLAPSAAAPAGGSPHGGTMSGPGHSASPGGAGGGKGGASPHGYH